MEDQFLNELKKNLIKYLNLVGLKPELIDNEMLLFGDGLGLDSIDSLEIIFMLEEVYKIEVNDGEDIKPALQSINTLGAFIQDRRALKDAV